MSLLLDALKKAAQQKAEKSRQEEIPTASPSEQTVIDPAVEDISVLEAGAGDSLQQSQHDTEDETELDTSQFQTRLEQTRIEDEDSDDTELEFPDSTQAQGPSLSTQMQTGEDETIVFDAEDVSDFLGEPELVRRESKGHEDTTDLDQTEYHAHHTAVDAEDSADATEIDQTEYQTHYTAVDAEDSADATEIDQTEYQTQHTAVDAEDSADATEIDQTEYQTQHTAVDAEGSADITDVPHDAIQDDDMSLLLVDHDDTNLTSRTSLTDPQTPQGIAQGVASADTAMDDLALVDTTQHRIPDDITDTAAPTQTNTAATTGIASETQITQGATTRVDSTSTRMDSTSTRTYAPDNYDRTLMKLPSDDESKIFAGMKSDSDVVMTPDYAKKVFRSKSSAQRMYVYKVYSGIAVVILLSIAIYGTFEFLDESNSIDSSLRPLKRDPMPGIIKPEELSQDTSLFAGSGTDARTIEIIENASNPGESVAAEEGIITDEGVIADETAVTDEVAMVENIAEVDNSTVISEPAVPAQAEPVATAQIASLAQAEVAAAEAESKSSTLEIISSSQVRQKDLWLREAYSAYQSGDNSRAMKLYNQVLEVDPGNRNALLARAAINVQNNNSTAAIKDYQALLLRNPKDSLAMTSLITVANLSPQETESQLKLMIRDEPDSAYLNFALANAYGAQNRWQEAQGYYFKALENNPLDPNYAYNLAVSLEHIAQPLVAVSYYQRALANINNSLATFNREIVSQRVEILAKQ